MRCSSTVPSNQTKISMQDDIMGSTGDNLLDDGRSPKDGAATFVEVCCYLETALTILATVKAYGYMFLAW